MKLINENIACVLGYLKELDLKKFRPIWFVGKIIWIEIGYFNPHPKTSILSHEECVRNVLSSNYHLIRQ